MVKTRLWIIGVLCCLLVRPVVCVGSSDVAMEAVFRQMETRFAERDRSLQDDLKAYLEQYPYTTYQDEVHFMSGVLYAEKAKWKQAAKAFEQVDYKALSRPHQPDYQFYRGYVYLMLQEYERALTYFAILRKTTNPYTQKAAYYWGYCQYKLQRYEQALPAFLSLESVREYQATVPYFIVQSYYAQGDFTEAQARAEVLLGPSPTLPTRAPQKSEIFRGPREGGSESMQGELHRMLGEIYYRKGDYKQAVSHLRAYVEAAATSEGNGKASAKANLVRNDIYLLGMAEYQLGAYQEAVGHLKQVPDKTGCKQKQEKDTVSESASLTLGHAYRKLGESGQLPSASAQEQAKMAYQAAIGYGLTPRVSEEALYNYTLCTYEHSSALGESVKAFTAFLKNYPQSQYREQIFTLLGDAFMRSKNYQAALNVLDSLSPAVGGDGGGLETTKQYLRYQLGVDAFLQGKMEKSRAWMTAVIDNSGLWSVVSGQKAEGASYTTEAYYWRAEAAYRLHDYEGCASDIAHYLAQPDVRRSANYASAAYLYGYALFSLRRFDEAGGQFLRYIDQASGQGGNEPTYADALNRLGDCAFNARDFRGAIAYYGQVID
ncbi:MAG: tetratricopeptide repeat protein, partial [Paludibacteraceae bacterium]